MAHAEPDNPISDSGLTHEQLKELIVLVAEKGVEEVDLELGEMKLKIVGRRGPKTVYANAPAATATAALPVAGGAPAALAVAPAPEEKAPVDELANSRKVTSPMVGTFYRAPSPDAPSFVDVGDRVEEDTVLCIIEAMKLMNEIKAEMRGTLRKVFVENGQPVEYGQPMFAIDPL
jgi:acetyl-CoA carboxylase biotin carboxyl carrier protein